MAPRNLRADAARNLAQMLDSGRTLIAREGPDVALDAVARHAGVGIGTFYRRFPDRGALLTGVADAALIEVAETATASAGKGDGLEGIGRYLSGLLGSRAAVVISMLAGRADVDHSSLRPARARAASAVRQMISRAHDDGSLAPEITEGDIGTLLVRLSRPLPGGLSAGEELRLARRHLDFALLGLRHIGSSADSPIGTGPSFSDLPTAETTPGQH